MMKIEYEEKIVKTKEIEVNKCGCGLEPKLNNYINGGNGCSLYGGTTISCDCGLRMNEHSDDIGYSTTKENLFFLCIEKWNRVNR